MAPGPAGGEADAEPAGELGVAAGGERGRLLVPALDEADLVLVLAQGLEDPVDPVAGQAEGRIHAPVDQLLDDDVARGLRHLSASSGCERASPRPNWPDRNGETRPQVQAGPGHGRITRPLGRNRSRQAEPGPRRMIRGRGSRVRRGCRQAPRSGGTGPARSILGIAIDARSPSCPQIRGQGRVSIGEGGVNRSRGRRCAAIGPRLIGRPAARFYRAAAGPIAACGLRDRPGVAPAVLVALEGPLALEPGLVVEGPVELLLFAR